MTKIADKVFASDGFRLLAQGMKDREAFQIVHALLDVKFYSGSLSPFELFERWAKETLEEQAKKDGL